MFEAYLIPIRYAILTFPIAAFVITLPFLIVQYRKYGYLHKFRAVIIYSLLLYLMTALYLVILPLPATRNTCTAVQGAMASFVPFRFVYDFWKETGVHFAQPSTYVQLFKERAFWQAAFNVLLLVPLGAYLRYYFRFRLPAAAVSAFGLSLFFEVTQVTGLYGIYDCPYRLFDVDDLLLNTSGGVIGYLAAPLLMKLLPRIEGLDENVDLKSERVGLTRRLIAVQLDAMLLFPLAVFFMKSADLRIYFITSFLYFIALPYATNGWTFGKYIVRIRVKGQGERIRLKELLIRYGSLYGIVGGLNAVILSQTVQKLPPILFALCAMVVLLVNLVFAVHVGLRLFRKDKTLIYEKWSGTGHEVV